MSIASKKRKVQVPIPQKNGQKSNSRLYFSQILAQENATLEPRSSLLSHPTTLSPLIHRFPNRENASRTLIVKPGQTRPNSYVPAFLTPNQLAFLPNRFYNKVKETNSSPSIRLDTLQGSKIGDKHVGGKWGEFVEENPYRKSVTTFLPSWCTVYGFERGPRRRINIINVVRRWINSARAKKRRGRVRGNARTVAKRNGTY